MGMLGYKVVSPSPVGWRRAFFFDDNVPWGLGPIGRVPSTQHPSEVTIIHRPAGGCRGAGEPRIGNG